MNPRTETDRPPDGEAGARAALLVRVWLPDRPGALGAVASRIGAVGGDVHEIEVVDRGAGRAIDELVVTVPETCPIELLTREIDEIDDVDVEDVEAVPAVPADPRMQALGAANDLAAAPDRVVLARVLAEHARREVRADHVAVVDGAAAEVVAEIGADADRLDTDSLVTFARGVNEAVGAGGRGHGQAEELSWTVVPGGSWTLLTTRRALALRAREREIVQALADLAGRLLERLERS